jgi:hypothetical protein
MAFLQGFNEAWLMLHPANGFKPSKSGFRKFAIIQIASLAFSNAARFGIQTAEICWIRYQEMV